VHSNLGTLRRYAEKLNALFAAHADHLPPDVPELVEMRKKLKIDFVLEDLPALIEESLEGTERIRKIVSDLKAFSHPAEHEPKYADLNDGLQSTLNIVHNEIKYKAQTVLELGDIPPVRCLPGQVNQVFMNLLVNAAHAIQDNGEIHISTKRDEGDVVITVRDTGSGIPPDVITRVFDPFFTTKEVGKGTGLGLSISYDIIRKHGGTITVSSEVGKGTIFTIRLPIEGPPEFVDG
jgi:two-component system NtrC family sensor kinase